MKIEVLGTGCPKCKKLYETVQLAAKELGVDIEIAKVEDLHAIMNFGVMLTPAIAINGAVKAAGRVPSAAEIKKWISQSSDEKVSS